MSEPGGAPSSSELASARPAFVPEVRRVRPAPATRFFGPTAAVGVVVGGILVWHLAPPAPAPVASLEPVVDAEVRSVDVVPVEVVAIEAVPVSVEPEVEDERDPSSPRPSGAPLPNEVVAAAPRPRGVERTEGARRPREVAPRSNDAPFVYPAAPAGEDRYDTARSCAIAGDHGCVLRELRGRCTQAREFELLIASMRALGGYSREVERAMREYQLRFPSGRQAASYRLYLIEHGASVE